ncbi:MAG: hypothetical protein WCK41_08985 [Actinomycetes bacterium]
MSRRRKKPVGARAAAGAGPKFWGRDGLIEPSTLIVPSHDPTAMIRSLGPPPLGTLAGPGEHYLNAAFDKAAGVAVALAAAGELLDFTSLNGPDSDR